jgi:hypothetical protein
MAIIMGIYRLPHAQNYLSSDPVLGVAVVSDIYKVQKIVQNLHCNNNPGFGKLHKIRPIIEKKLTPEVK